MVVVVSVSLFVVLGRPYERGGGWIMYTVPLRTDVLYALENNKIKVMHW